MNIIVCLTDNRQFGRIDNDNLSLVSDLNEATKFQDNFSDELSYNLIKFREKYTSYKFVTCNLNNIMFNEPIKGILNTHINGDKLGEVLY